MSDSVREIARSRAAFECSSNAASNDAPTDNTNVNIYIALAGR